MLQVLQNFLNNQLTSVLCILTYIVEVMWGGGRGCVDISNKEDYVTHCTQFLRLHCTGNKKRCNMIALTLVRFQFMTEIKVEAREMKIQRISHSNP